MAGRKNETEVSGPAAARRSVVSPRTPPAQQVVEGSTFKKVRQSSDQVGTLQTTAQSTGDELSQSIVSSAPEFSAFGIRGRGLVAVLIPALLWWFC